MFLFKDIGSDTINQIYAYAKMMIDTMGDVLPFRALNYLKIILNSALHLECVVEDSLEMSRLENN